MLKLILLIAACLLVLLIPLVWMIFKYYWGPTGKPPEYKAWDRKASMKDEGGRMKKE